MNKRTNNRKLVETMHGEGYLTVQEAFRASRMDNIGSIYRWLQEGKIAGRRVGPRLFVHAGSLNAWLKGYLYLPEAEPDDMGVSEIGVTTRSEAGGDS